MHFGSHSRRARLLTSAATGFALVASGAAFAQDADADEEEREVITVTGIRASIENSIEAKRESTSIVEAISAEDIGKLPDVSIAESLARLPGLAAQRLRGRAQVISVRGLGPDFTTALLNGREQVTAGDNRGVEFDQYPSELISQVVVYKTPDAALLGQGLAGTADLRTIRPLEFGKQALSFNARYEVNSLGALNAGSEDDGYRFTGSYVDQFANDTIGLVLGFSAQSSPTQAERWEAWGFPETDGNLIIGGAKPYVESRELERTALLGTLEFQPDDILSMSFDAFYTDFEDGGNLRGIELPLFWSGAQLQPGFTVQDGLITQGVFNGVQGVVRNDFRGREAEVLSLGFNTAIDLGAWNFEVDVSTSRVDRTDIDLESYSGTGSGFGVGASDNLAFSQVSGGAFAFASQLNYADPSLMLLTDPQGWGQVGFLKQPSTEDELTAVRLEAERFLDGPIASVEVGVNFTERNKGKRSDESFIDLTNPGATNTAAIPTNLLIGSTSLDFIGIPGMVSYDPFAVLASGLYTLRPNTNADVITKSWDVDENVITAYIMANVDTTLGGVPTVGNFGVQYVDTDQSSTGASVLSGGINQFTAGDEYTEWLPSANLQFEVMDNTFVRVGAARTLARARMDQLRASQELSLNSAVCSGNQAYSLPNSVCFSASGGNPQLRPYLADSIDLSVERYFGGAGYVSVAAFYKDLSDYVDDNVVVPIDFGGLGEQLLAANGFAADPTLLVGTVSGPDNGDGGWLQGLEFAVSVPGDLFLPAPFDGLGVIASLSLTDSEVTPADGSDPITIPGLSETVSNITVYYEKAGFEARVSNRYRSEFLAEVTGFGANRDFRQALEENVVDAQIGYSFGPGPLDGVSVLFQANNLTNERFGTFANGDERQVRDYQEYGTTYLFGINYRR